MSALVAVLAMSLSAQAHALDDQIAERIVRNYSEAIACQISHTSYKAVEIQQGGPDPKDLGTVYVVHWKGDIGCVGGNANHYRELFRGRASRLYVCHANC